MEEVAVGRILVVDDDASVCRALARLLRSFGYVVDTQGSAQALLDAGVPSDAVCLVTDVRMPTMGGIELRDRLEAMGWDLPVVFVTAHGTEGLSPQVLAGATVLQKPVDGEALDRAIRAACRGRLRARR